MKAIWNFFNNKKTAIGAACFFISVSIIEELCWHTWFLDWPWLKYTNDVLLWAGNILVPVGIAHKGAKAFIMDAGKKP